MTKDETWRKKRLKASVSDNCSVGLRRLFHMTITSIPRQGDVVVSDRRRSVPRHVGLVNVRPQMFHLFQMTIPGPESLRRGVGANLIPEESNLIPASRRNTVSLGCQSHLSQITVFKTSRSAKGLCLLGGRNCRSLHSVLGKLEGLVS
jgi:hypothetical protein